MALDWKLIDFWYFIRGIAALLFYAVNTLFWSTPLLALAVVRLALPFKRIQTAIRQLLIELANCWIWFNNLNQKWLSRVRWEVSGLQNMNPTGSTMVIANHQSWVDILVLQNVFYRKIPFLKFFLKKELFWFPVLGQAWWALDFPFMKRYSRQTLIKKPHLMGKDLEITRKACRKLRTVPVSVMNFVEGTRFTRKKHAQQKSPFTHLLRPKAGGLAFSLAAMEDKLKTIVDVSIAYPDGVSFWKLLCGRMHTIRVHVETWPVTRQLVGDYLQNTEFREAFQNWLNQIWSSKDCRLEAMLKAPLNESQPIPECASHGPYSPPAAIRSCYAWLWGTSVLKRAAALKNCRNLPLRWLGSPDVTKTMEQESILLAMVPANQEKGGSVDPDR